MISAQIKWVNQSSSAQRQRGQRGRVIRQLLLRKVGHMSGDSRSEGVLRLYGIMFHHEQCLFRSPNGFGNGQGKGQLRTESSHERDVGPGKSLL